MLNQYTRVYLKELLSFLELSVYDRIYFVLCLSFLFFKRKFSRFLNVMQLHKYVYFYIFGNIFLAKVSKFLPEYNNMRFASIYWLVFTVLHDMLFEDTKKYNIHDTWFFWSFIVYDTIKDNFMFGFKSIKVFVGFWPKYIYTPDVLFNDILIDAKQHKTKILFVPKKKEQAPFVFQFLKNKKIKKVSFVVNKKKITDVAVHYGISNLSWLFDIFKQSKFVLFFIRKQKFFNKGRYSRNRQLYRTGVYWCIYVNIVAVLGLNFLFYKFTINFSYYWWLFIIAATAFFAPYFFKISLYSYKKHCKNFLQYIQIPVSANFFSLCNFVYYSYEYIVRGSWSLVVAVKE